MKVFIIEKGFSSMKDQEQGLTAQLRSLGWRVRTGSNNALLLERKGLRFLAHPVRAPQSYTTLLEAFMARAWLESQAQAKKQGARPLAMLAAPVISDALIDKLALYMDRVAPDAHWAITDDRGRVEFRGPRFAGQSLSVPASTVAQPSMARRAPKRASLFSDVHQWLLKVLLAAHIPKRLLSAPRGPFRNASVLAEAANVSQPSVSRFLSRLEQEGFLDRSRGELRLAKASLLLERWRTSTWKPAHEVGARLLLSSRQANVLPLAISAATSTPRKPGQRLCLGLFAACDALELHRVKGAPVHLYMEDPSPQALESLGLVHVSAGERADVLIRVPHWPETVFRGVVAGKGGALATDVIQCWLDVSHSANRGSEQADFLWRRALAPSLAA